MFILPQQQGNAMPKQVEARLSCSISAVNAVIPRQIPISIYLTCSSSTPVNVDFGRSELGNLRFFLYAPGDAPEARRLEIPSLTYPGSVVVTPQKPYKTRINLGALELRPSPDVVNVSLSLMDSKGVLELLESNTISISKMSSSQEEVQEASLNLAHEIQNSTSVEEKLELASELSMIRDSAAVPAVAALLGRKDCVDIQMIDALAAIGTDEAGSILRKYAETADKDNARYALSMLRQFDKRKEKLPPVQ